jgi:UDP-GlcNAc:undecaprenyl-phosphate GlcNAc-1-phosphate transferase
LLTLTYKRRLFEIFLDVCLIAIAYYLAFILRFEFHLDAANTERYLISLPIILIATSSSLFLAGVYRGMWRYTGLDDLLWVAIGVAVGVCVTVAALLLLYRFAGYSRAVFVLYPLLLFLGIATSRLSFRLFARWLARPGVRGLPVLIYGADDGGQLVVQECRRSPHLGYRPIGFLDDDPRKQGCVIQGLPVLGGADGLPEILQRQEVTGLIIASPAMLMNGRADMIRAVCDEQAVWMKTLRLEFVEKA